MYLLVKDWPLELKQNILIGLVILVFYIIPMIVVLYELFIVEKVHKSSKDETVFAFMCCIIPIINICLFDMALQSIINRNKKEK